MKVKHTIGVVSRRTGLSPHLIRIWERRYGAVTPQRTKTNRRLYTEDDIRKLSLLKQATRAGEAIGQIANLSIEDLTRLVEQNRAIESTVNSQILVTPDDDLKGSLVDDYFDRCIKAVATLQPSNLEKILFEASHELSKPVLLSSVILPLLDTIGRMWQEGSIKVLHEHQASTVIRTFLGNLSTIIKGEENAPVLITATPPGQHHEFGALLAALTALFDGWQAVYIGSNTPIDDIVEATRRLKAKVLALSLIYPTDDPTLPNELIRLKNALESDVRLVVGGQAASAYSKTLSAIDAILVNNLIDFREILKTIRFGAN
jgi:DNA-binding transcriptional MerR regulator